MSDGPRKIGLGPLTVLALAALGVPRVIAHDLALVGPLVNGLLVFVPIAVWIAYVLWKRVPNPLVTLLAVGLAYGALLGITHQILWTAAFAGDPPQLGGNLAGTLSPGMEAVVVRLFAFGSSLFTGVLLGAGTGAASWLLARLVPAFRPQ
ncbi:hypothetical protein EV191_11059 [Tamaricihabitans halophyticus]|uniref:Energy-coupling factor transport system substrate-specific component n=1 Tax=Tamaricihabitans halophyticus TaxID=1262583 RepID=A0A4R2QGY5_9PSEU|nr:hypothetical protein [Tamaricihabitans halophyticus]TCP48502.1 hypothetical protein EV191_11059 [Tamaricihabitans halophyticus]